MKNFALNEIHLTDGEFSARKELVRKYLNELDTDRIMHTFRLNAGIPSGAKPLGGWESPDCGLRGHFVGHFLSACARFGFCDEDENLRGKAMQIVDIMEQCQKENGYLSAFPEEVLDTLEREENRDIWAPYYTLAKILQGLLDCAALLDIEKAQKLAVGLANYIYKRFQKLSYWKIDGILRCTRVNPNNEFGGIGDSLYTLYERTGENWVKELAELFDRDYFIGRLACGQDILENLHANTHLPMVYASMHRYQITGEDRFRTAAFNFYRYLKGRTFANGNSSSKATAYIKGMVSEKSEHWGAFGHLEDALTGGESESCCAHNTEKIVQKLFEWTGDADYLDHLERLKYNAVLNSASSRSGLSQYHQPLGEGVVKKFSDAYDSFWCCTASGVEALSELQKNIWFHEDNALLVQGFISSTLDWKEKGIKIAQTTKYPDELKTVLTFEMDHPTEIELLFRKNVVNEVMLNGTQVEFRTENGYLKIKRVFRQHDVLEVRLLADLHLETLQGSDNIAALMYGNILLAAIGENPAFLGITKENILDNIQRWPGENLCYELTDKNGAKTKFIPLYRVEEEIYTVYIDLSAEKGERKEFTCAEDGRSAYK